MTTRDGRRLLGPIALIALLSVACPGADRVAPHVTSAPSPTRSPATSSSPGAAMGPVDVDYHHHTKIDRYGVSGSTPSQIYVQVRQRGPGRFAGEAGWQLSYDTIGDYVAGGRCHLTRVVVNLDVTLTLPDWNPPAGVSGSTRAYWDRTSAVLERHERGHEKLAEQYARRLIHELTDVKAAVSCAKLYRRGDDRADRVFSAMNRANRRYDAVTDHGVNQAAA